MRAFDFTGELARLKSELQAEKRKGTTSSGGGASGSGSSAQHSGDSGLSKKTAGQIFKSPREIKRSCVTTTGALGHGAFGDVFKAVLSESSRHNSSGHGAIVAIKTAQVSKVHVGRAEQEAGAAALMHEATLMMILPEHENVVSIIGVVTVGTPLLLVLSYCEHGSLLNYLDRFNVSLASKLRLSRDLAAGMAHVAHCKMIHRDIAARNVLITAAEVAQIADFGLARLGKDQVQDDYDNMHDLYYVSFNGTFPVRWTAPEAMENLRFTRETDVWSYGVTLTEFFNIGMVPYATLDNHKVISAVMGGYTIPKPADCPAVLFDTLIAPCWSLDPKARPSFEAILSAFDTSPGMVSLFRNNPKTAMDHFNPCTRRVSARDAPTDAEARGATAAYGLTADAGNHYLLTSDAAAASSAGRREGHSDHVSAAAAAIDTSGYNVRGDASNQEARSDRAATSDARLHLHDVPAHSTQSSTVASNEAAYAQCSSGTQVPPLFGGGDNEGTGGPPPPKRFMTRSNGKVAPAFA